MDKRTVRLVVFNANCGKAECSNTIKTLLCGYSKSQFRLAWLAENMTSLGKAEAAIGEAGPESRLSLGGIEA